MWLNFFCNTFTVLSPLIRLVFPASELWLGIHTADIDTSFYSIPGIYITSTFPDLKALFWGKNSMVEKLYSYLKRLPVLWSQTSEKQRWKQPKELVVLVRLFMFIICFCCRYPFVRGEVCVHMLKYMQAYTYKCVPIWYFRLIWGDQDKFLKETPQMVSSGSRNSFILSVCYNGHCFITILEIHYHLFLKVFQSCRDTSSSKDIQG